MNTAAAKQAMKQYFQTLTDGQLQHYHLNHDYLTGRPLATPQMPSSRGYCEDVTTQKQQRNLTRLNEVLYPTPTLGSVLGDALSGLKLTPEVSSSLDIAPLEKPSDNLVSCVKIWFDQYQADGLESLLPSQSGQLSDENLAVIKYAFSRNTILIQNVCMLSPFWIRNPLEWDAKGGVGLLEHLFVQYDAPTFIKACWSEVIDGDNVHWLLCFIVYAQGGSLKVLAEHFGWKTLSNKLWHQLFTSPVDASPQHAVLYAEFKRLGGWDQDVVCLMNDKSYVIDLLDPVSEEGRDFWYDTIRWIINKQFDLTVEAQSKVLWWARHQLTEQARQGETYRLQGRSQSKVLESIAVYEHEQLQIQQARTRMAERARQVSMMRVAERAERDRLRQEQREMQAVRHALYENEYFDYETADVSWKGRGWNWSTTAHGKQWHFVELTTSQALRNEGDAMNHCVGSYVLPCMDGHSVIVSLMCEGDRTATIEVDPLVKHLVQIQGEDNAEPIKSVLSVTKAWMKCVVKR